MRLKGNGDYGCDIYLIHPYSMLCAITHLGFVQMVNWSLQTGEAHGFFKTWRWETMGGSTDSLKWIRGLWKCHLSWKSFSLFQQGSCNLAESSHIYGYDCGQGRSMFPAVLESVSCRSVREPMLMQCRLRPFNYLNNWVSAICEQKVVALGNCLFHGHLLATVTKCFYF